MEDKNIALLGFVSSAAKYLEDILTEESEEIKELKEIDFDSLKNELSKRIGSSFNGAKNNSNDLISAGREVFDEFISKKPVLIDEFEDIFNVDFKKENDEKNAAVTNNLLKMLRSPQKEEETAEFEEIVSKVAAVSDETEKEEKKPEIVIDKEEEDQIDSIFTEILSHENNLINVEEPEIEEVEEEVDLSKFEFESFDELDSDSIFKIIEEVENDIGIDALNARVEAAKSEEINIVNLAPEKELQTIVDNIVEIIVNNPLINLPSEPIIEDVEADSFEDYQTAIEEIELDDITDEVVQNIRVNIEDFDVKEEIKEEIVIIKDFPQVEQGPVYDVKFTTDIIVDHLKDIVGPTEPVVEEVKEEAIGEENPLEEIAESEDKETEETNAETVEENVVEDTEELIETVQEEQQVIAEEISIEEVAEDIRRPLSERLRELKDEYKEKAIKEVETYIEDIKEKTIEPEKITTLSEFLNKLKSDETLYKKGAYKPEYNLMKEETTADKQLENLPRHETLSDLLKKIKSENNELAKEETVVENTELPTVEEVIEDATAEVAEEIAEIEEEIRLASSREAEEAALREFESRTLNQLYIPNPGLDVLEQIEEEERIKEEQINALEAELENADNGTQELIDLISQELEKEDETKAEEIVVTETSSDETEFEEAVLEEEITTEAEEIPATLEEENKEEIFEKTDEETAEIQSDEFVEVTTAQYNQDDYIAELLSTLNNDAFAKEIEDARAKEEATRNEVYESIKSLYPYLTNGFIRGVYDLKEPFMIEYEDGEPIIILHRLVFTELEGLQRFVEVMIDHGYAVNADEDQMIVDVFKDHINSDGKILNDIFEVANQAKLLTGEYDGYRIIREDETIVVDK